MVNDLPTNIRIEPVVIIGDGVEEELIETDHFVSLDSVVFVTEPRLTVLSETRIDPDPEDVSFRDSEVRDKIETNFVEATVLTTIESSNANMWVWRIDGSTGSLDWERVTLPNGDTDSDSPRVRLPGPVIVQLDDDDIPEVIFTIPTDGNGRSSGSGATLVAWELTAAEEIWSFRTPNGYADAPPLPIDTDGDGIHDRVCWVTWYSSSQWNFEELYQVKIGRAHV